MSERWKYFLPGYLWSLPNTLIGVLLMLWYLPTSIRWKDGCIEAIPRKTLIGGPLVGAQTFGWIIFCRDEHQRSRSSLAVHERVHVVQGFILGPLFLPLYGLPFLWCYYVRGYTFDRAYRAIWAEVQAYRIGDLHQAGVSPDAWGSR